MVEQLHPPPKPSLPKEAPWREIEEIIDGLRAVASKLDTLISIYTGVAPPVEVVVTPPEVVVPPPTVIIPEMPAIPPPVVIPPAPIELVPITDRLDDLRRKFDALLSLLAWALAPAAPSAIVAPELAPITRRLDILISALITNKKTFATGQKDVATAGEPEQLDDWPIADGFKLVVIARTGNTGYIYLGKNKGDCANNKRRFDGLEAGMAHSFRVKNANAVWVDASVDGEGVSWIVEAYR